MDLLDEGKIGKQTIAGHGQAAMCDGQSPDALASGSPDGHQYSEANNGHSQSDVDIEAFVAINGRQNPIFNDLKHGLTVGSVARGTEFTVRRPGGPWRGAPTRRRP